jgi:alkanesulfonate monooxygenase SsuD/methylene tetrahydromethanopterin reductase-like flavin-dependent oxidoreductase (luciferase family)
MHTDWPALMNAGARIDQLGWDHLWSWDHLLPIEGSLEAPIFESLMTLAGWAGVTRNVGLGPMVAANTFRNPALLVKMATTLDHMSDGRAILGMGAGWFEPEHRAFGLELGASAGERLDWLDESAAIVRDLLDGRAATARGPHFTVTNLVNDPPPRRRAMPLLIGGSGERKTLATVARYADMWCGGGSADELRHKDDVLRTWCQRVGRDESAIERMTGVGAIVIRESLAEARKVAAETGRANGGWAGPALVGPPELIAERLAPIVASGFRTLYVDFPAPFDEETMERLITDVKPMLEASA